jgi:gluconolactonase
VDADGTLYVAQNGGIWGAPGPAEPGVQVIHDGTVDYLARGLGAPNDLTFGPDGRLWVTDTRGEITWPDPADALPGRAWAIDVTSGAAELVLDDGPLFVNGLAFTPDGHRLLVTETLSAVLTAYDVEGGGLGPPVVLHRFAEGHPDGMAIDSDGVAWVALTSADHVGAVSADGELVASVATGAGSLPTNVCLGETDGELLVTAAHAGSLLRVRVNAE